MAYVYKHIRLDTNDVFYIGVGSDKYYSRANSKHSRNKHWLNVVNKVGYKVEIIIDNISFDLALKKEIELISGYKLISEGGCLVNYTKGGQGRLGFTPSHAKKIFSQNILTEEIIEFNSILEASETLKIARANILAVLNNKNRYAKNFIFNYDKTKLNINIRNTKNNNKGWLPETPIYITKIDEYKPQYFKSISECIKTTVFNFSSSKLSRVKNGLQKKHKNHIVANTLHELKEKFLNITSKSKNSKNYKKEYASQGR
jgi:hypothetical protein